jgi:hypothetical protein
MLSIVFLHHLDLLLSNYLIIVDRIIYYFILINKI